MRVSIGLCLAALGGAVLGCGTDKGVGDPTIGDSARITTRDTTLLGGETASFLVQVQYVFGPGAPTSVVWNVSDTAVIHLDVISQSTSASMAAGSAFLTAKAPGSTKLTAFINKTFSDTITVTVVNPGSVRWRVDLAAQAFSGAAVDDSDHAFVLAGASLVSFDARGAQRWAGSSCLNVMSPSVREDNGAVMSTGNNCTRRHDATGATLWTAPVGSSDAGVALTADDGLIALSAVGTPGGVGAVIVSRFSAQGAEVWRDTLAATPVLQKSTPAVASNGDIYVPWKTDSSRLTRIATNDSVRWTRPLPGWAHYTSPAIDTGRVYVAYEGGLVALDTAGTVLWNAALPAGVVSSPIIDPSGNVYVQSQRGLYAFSRTGSVQWHADTLGGSSGLGPVGAPTLIASGVLIVPCGNDVCAVQSTDGSLSWRSALGGGTAGSATVASDGTILVTHQAANGNGELVALWNHTLPVLAGWPTEGHDAQRSRRQF